MSEPSQNGGAAQDPDEATEGARPDVEQIAEEWAERAGRWVLRTAARVREEAEDIWAEAQDVRRRL